MSLQNNPSVSNFLVKTDNISNPSSNLDSPIPPSLNNPITTQPSTSHSPHHYNTPSNSPPQLSPITSQPSISQIRQIFLQSLFALQMLSLLNLKFTHLNKFYQQLFKS